MRNACFISRSVFLLHSVHNIDYTDNCRGNIFCTKSSSASVKTSVWRCVLPDKAAGLSLFETMLSHWCCDVLRDYQCRPHLDLVAPSIRSSLPSTLICTDFHVNFEVEALAFKLKTKQLATDATSSLSGDQQLPCPSNSNGAADAIDSNPSLRY